MGGIVSAGAGKVGWLAGTVYVHHRAPIWGVLMLIVIRPIRAVSLTEGIVSLSPQRTLPDPQTSEY